MGTSYRKNFSTKDTKQGQKMPGTDQVKNSDGAFVFGLSDWKRLDRFLILGSEQSTYYTKAAKLTVDNAEAVLRCIQEDGIRVVKTIAEISDAGRAAKNDPAIFALAMCAKLGDDETRRLAYQALPAVCRIPTHLFHFAEFCEGFGGWGRGQRKAVSRWYTDKKIGQLAYHLVKYQSRDGWSNRDILRLAHVKPRSEAQNELFHWVTKGELSKVRFACDKEDSKAIKLVEAFEEAKRADSSKTIVKLITEHNLPRECIPTQFLSEASVWEALFQRMPLGALVRNLGNMSKVGYLKALTPVVDEVVTRLTDTAALRKSRIHPLQLLVALNTYNAGQGVRGKGVWKPVQQVVDALDAGFYKAFDNVEPSGKRHMLCIDTSGSMTWENIVGMPGITPRIGSAAMALVTAAVEKSHLFVAWSDKASELSISPKQRLDSVVARLGKHPAYSTNAAAPMQLALERGYEVDTFTLYTDSQTNHMNAEQPIVALRKYREKTGIPAKFIVVGMTSNGFSIADPNDGGMLDVVGFDTSAPRVISQFSAE